MKTAFICYSHNDASFAESLAQRLRNAGIGVWLDQLEFKVGVSVIEKIKDAIRNQDYVIALLSKHSIHSRWVLKEIRAALQKGSKVVLPVALPGLDDSEILPLLRDRLYADFRKDPEEEFRKLLEVLQPGGDWLQDASDLRERIHARLGGYAGDSVKELREIREGKEGEE